MAGTVQPALGRAGATFALDSLTIEDGRVLVSGHWDGVRGLRFVRPTLVVSGREVLATLEHKPWAPDGDPWVAAFPWGDDDAPADDVWLSVAPSVTVPLAIDPGDKPEARPRDAQAAKLHDQLRALRVERDALRDRLNDAIRDRDAALRTRNRMEAQRDEAFAERNAAERRRNDAIAERDQALARRDEAVADRQVAMRAHRKMQGQRDEARVALEVAERERDEALGGVESARQAALRTAGAERDQALHAVEAERNAALQAIEAERDAALRAAQAERDAVRGERDAVLAERDEALAQRDEARIQRDDALLAQRALQRRIEKEAAERERAAEFARAAERDASAGSARAGEREGAAERTRAAETDGAAEPGSDKPLGVRTVPAARSLGADLAPAPEGPGRGLTAADRVAIRVFASVAAVCAFLLLVTLARIFV